MGRVFAQPACIRWAHRAQSGGARVVFTNGVFDLLHYGHVAYLQKARRLGDLLVVAVNTDRSVRKLKGASRPWMPLTDRMRVLAALSCVDAVTSFAEDTPEKLITRLGPDVLVKGADYRLHEIVGASSVKGKGGRVVRIPLSAGRSTSRLMSRILKS